MEGMIMIASLDLPCWALSCPFPPLWLHANLWGVRRNQHTEANFRCLVHHYLTMLLCGEIPGRS